MPDEEVDRLLAQAELRLGAARHLLMNDYYEECCEQGLLQHVLCCNCLASRQNIQVKTHRGLVARFGQEFVERGLMEKHFGRILRIAMELRSEADYSISRQISKEEAAVTVDDAEKFLMKAKEVVAEIEKVCER